MTTTANLILVHLKWLGFRVTHLDSDDVSIVACKHEGETYLVRADTLYEAVSHMATMLGVEL